MLIRVVLTLWMLDEFWVLVFIFPLSSVLWRLLLLYFDSVALFRQRVGKILRRTFLFIGVWVPEMCLDLFPWRIWDVQCAQSLQLHLSWLAYAWRIDKAFHLILKSITFWKNLLEASRMFQIFAEWSKCA